MLGDTAVAVHPDDERYTDLIGKEVLLPIVNRRIPIVADEYADPEKGSGAVKITPAHDFNDFEVGKRGLAGDQRFGPRPASATMRSKSGAGPRETGAMTVGAEPGELGDQLTEMLPEHLRGLDRFEARDVIIKDFENLGLLDKIEENPMTVPYGDRSGVVIEPLLTDQWFVRRRSRWPNRPSRRWRAAGPSSCRRTGTRPISSGCATSSPGASRGRSGGGIRFRPGTARTATSSSN